SPRTCLPASTDPTHSSTFPYTTLFRSSPLELASAHEEGRAPRRAQDTPRPKATSAPDPDPDIEVEIGPEMLASILRVETAAEPRDRKSTRLNSSHVAISYAVFCLKKKS